MFISNGIVYGGEPKNGIRIKEAKPLNDGIMLLTFTTGEVRLFDATILEGKAFEKLREKSVFDNPVIEYGVVTWDNGSIDCAPEYMYDNSYEYMTAVSE